VKWERENPERAREIRIASQARQADKRAARQQAREAAIRAGQRGHKCELVVAVYAVARAWRAAGVSVHVDHVHPIARGGRHEWQNLNILPAIENLKKGARHA
jgi:5-methylcytosine-specific restriction endonuclease McrA